MIQKPTYKELKQQIKDLEKNNILNLNVFNKIEASEKFHRIVLENISDAVLISDDQGQIVYVCPNTVNIFGLSQTEVSLLGTTHKLLNGSVCDVPELRKKKEINNIEWSVRNKAGQERSLLINVKSVNINNGTVLYVMRDITERKHVGNGLKQSREMLESVFESISDPLVMLDDNLKVKLINNAAKKYYGVQPQDRFENSCCFDFFRKEKFPCEGCKIPMALKNKEYLCYERKGLFNPGKLEQVTIYPGIESKLEENYAIVRINDITKLREIEEELAHADKMISLGVLVSGMAHEINNPNNFIMMNSRLLLNSWKSIVAIVDQYYEKNGDFSMGGLPYSEMRIEFPELLMGIEKSSNRIKRTIKDLKAFARKDDVRMDESVRINRVIQNAMEFTHQLIKDSTNCFQTRIEPDLPVIQGNRQRLEQVLINLIQNACQALSDKSQEIFLKSNLNEDKDRIVIELRDQGKGIPPHVLPRVMDPFFTTRRTGGGTGLGLSISSNIIKEHGGSIRVESQEGEGAVFKILLPLHKKENPYKILIADDDPGSRKMLTAILKRSNRFSVRETDNGAEALLKIGQDMPDLLILDIHMPDMDGAEVCRLIKSKPELSLMKVVIITGFMNSPKAEEISKMGFNTFLGKPIEKTRLLKTVDNILEIGS